jgi:hypothetical protein
MRLKQAAERTFHGLPRVIDYRLINQRFPGDVGKAGVVHFRPMTHFFVSTPVILYLMGQRHLVLVGRGPAYKN